MKSQSQNTNAGMTRIHKRGRVGVATLKKRQRVRDAAIVLSFFVVVSLFYVWSRVAVLQTGYRIHQQAQEYKGMEDQYRSLRLELATLKSPNRLAPMAARRLGLKQPSPAQIVIVPEPIRIAEQEH